MLDMVFLKSSMVDTVVLNAVIPPFFTLSNNSLLKMLAFNPSITILSK